jgi:arylsulfatase A-like enzyme
VSALLLALLCAAGTQERRGSNIVLIVAEGVGAGDLGAGTPRLDALAAEGMRWTQFYAGAPVPEASRRALLTGRHGGRAASRKPIAAGTPTLLTVLESAGYAVGSVEGESPERFLREKREKPFFLLWSTPLPADGARAARMKALDDAVGRVLDLLKDRASETLVVFTSSGGPSGDVTEAGLRVPMIARWPGTVAAGSLSDEHAWAGDLLPTFAELAGAAAPADLDGDSLAETLRGRPRKDRWRRAHELYWESATAQATRFGKWKAIRSPIGTGTIELYDMSNDPGEKRDYAARRPDLARHAAAVLDKRREP